MKQRVGLTRSATATRPECVVVVEPTWDAIATAAANKFNKLSFKQIRRLVLRGVSDQDLPAGDCSFALVSRHSSQQDALIYVATSDASETLPNVVIDVASLPLLPRWDTAGQPQLDTLADGTADALSHLSTADPSSMADASSTSSATLDEPSPPPSSSSDGLGFDGPFPVLAGDVRQLVREAIRGVHGFTESRVGECICFDYKSDEASPERLFPPPGEARSGSRERWMRGLRRECRGLLLSASTGAVVARRFHKFFNLGEMAETMPENLPSLESHECRYRLITKLDGSLASPLLLHAASADAPSSVTTTGTPVLIWATRKHEAPTIAAFVSSHDASHAEGRAQYSAFALGALSRGFTPLFEWCEAKHSPGVVQHAQDSLTLLAMRHMVSGRYLGRDQLVREAAAFGVPIAAEVPIPEALADANGRSDIGTSDAVAQSEGGITVAMLQRKIFDAWQGVEGAVLVDERDGSMYKLKSSWWLALSGATKEGRSATTALLLAILRRRPTLDGVPSAAIWSAALCESRDDTVAACAALLQAGGSHAGATLLMSFARAADARVAEVRELLATWSDAAHELLASSGIEAKRVSAVRVALQSVVMAHGWTRSVAIALTSGGAANDDESATRTRAGEAILAQLRAAAASAKETDRLERVLWLRWKGWRGGTRALLPIRVLQEADAAAIRGRHSHHEEGSTPPLPPPPQAPASVTTAALARPTPTSAAAAIAHTVAPVVDVSAAALGEYEAGRFYHFGLLPALESLQHKVVALRALTQTMRIAGVAGHSSRATAMRRAESADGDWLCVIMRGVPGCGKSSIAREMADAWRVTHQASQRSSNHAAICSADSFFEAGAGLSRRRLRELAAVPGAPRDTYRLVFSVERLGRAHQHCRQQFADAINYECGLVIVDNTNTTLDECSHYQRTALHWGYEVLVVEVRSDQNDLGAVEAMRARCTHGVPMPTMLRLNERFEPDDRSNAVARVRPLGLACSNTTPPAPQPSAETSGAQGPTCI